MNKLTKKSDGWFEICAERIKESEALRIVPYLCPKGKLTVLYGRNIEPEELQRRAPSSNALELAFILKNLYNLEKIADFLLTNDMMDVYLELIAYFGDTYGRPLGSVESFDSLPDNVKIALVDMGYNMGMPSLFGFEKMFEAIDRRDWETASAECLDSIYGRDKDSKARAEENAELIRGCV